MFALAVLAFVAAADTTAPLLYPVQEDGRFGYIDAEGTLVVSFQFDEGEPFTEARAAVRVGDRWGFLGPDGRIAIAPVFERVGAFAEELAPVQVDSLWGFVAPDGRIAVEPQYDQVSGFHEGRAPVRRVSLWGFIGPTGREVIAPRYTAVGPFREGRAQVATGWKENPANAMVPGEMAGFVSYDFPPEPAMWGYVDRTGREVVSPRYAYAQPFSEGLAAVLDGDRWGYVDTTGAIVLAPQFARAAPFSEGLAWVHLAERTEERDPEFGFVSVSESRPAFIRRDGSVAFRFEDAPPPMRIFTGDGLFLTGTDVRNDGVMEPRFSEGLVALSDRETQQWGYRDREGTWVFEPQWDLTTDFQDGTAWVWKHQKGWGAPRRTAPARMRLTRDGEIQHFEGFLSFESGFEDGLALISFGVKEGYIDREGRTVIGPRFWSAQPFSGGIAVAEEDGQPVVIDTTGRVVFRAPGEFLGAFSEGFAAFEQDERWGLVRATGEVAVPPRFAWVSPVRDGLAVAREQTDGPVGVIDTTGAWVLAPTYDNLHLLSEGLLAYHTVPDSDIPYDEDWLYDVGRYGIVDLQGREILPAVLQEIEPFAFGLAAAQTPYDEDGDGGGRWGYLAPDGTWAIEPQYVVVQAFTADGLATVSTFDDIEDTGVIDRTGALVLPLSDRYITSFSEGIAVAKDPETDLYGLIDTTGAWVVEPTFAFLSAPREGRVHAIVDGGRAFIDLTGRIVTPTFGLVDDFSEGLAAVRFPAETGYVDEAGRIVWPREDQ